MSIDLFLGDIIALKFWDTIVTTFRIFIDLSSFLMATTICHYSIDCVVTVPIHIAWLCPDVEQQTLK